MATFARLNSGRWRAQVRRKGRYAADAFLRRRDAEMWTLEVERAIDLGQTGRRKNGKCIQQGTIQAGGDAQSDVNTRGALRTQEL